MEIKKPNVRKHESLELIDLLRRAIIIGDYRPRERLIENELAAKYSVSRTPIREALKHLQALGLVKIEKNKGAMVADLNPVEVKEIQIVRANLEGLAAYLATSQLSYEEIEKLREIEELMESAVVQDDIHQFSTLNDQFHMLIYARSNNHFLYDTILQLLKRSWHAPSLSWKALGDVSLVVKGHQNILSALYKRDANRAKEAAEQHIYDAIHLMEESQKREDVRVQFSLYMSNDNSERGHVNR